MYGGLGTRTVASGKPAGGRLSAWSPPLRPYILGYLKNTQKNLKFGKVRQVPTRGFPTKFPDWDSVSFFQIWDFCGHSLNTLKYTKMGICYFFLCLQGGRVYPVARFTLARGLPWNSHISPFFTRRVYKVGRVTLASGWPYALQGITRLPGTTFLRLSWPGILIIWT